MNLLFDTNIIINIVRSVDHIDIIQFLNPRNLPTYISVVYESEIKSIALQNDWGINRLNFLTEILDQSIIIDVSRLDVNTYVELDAYSQLRNPDFHTYPFATPRNMGKNDLWIASLASLLGFSLLQQMLISTILTMYFLMLEKSARRNFYLFLRSKHQHNQ